MPVVKRLFLALSGYLASILVFFLALALLFAGASALFPDIGAWSVMGVSPVLALGAPVAGLFLIVAAMTLSAIPMLIAVLLTEWFGWRSVWIYAVPASVVTAAAYLALSPRVWFGADILVAAELAIFAVAGAIAGLLYWAIAGRNAGFRSAI